MASNKSLDFYKEVVATLLCDVRNTHCEVFTNQSLQNTYHKVRTRCEQEGFSFLTKTLPRLGKALDFALAGNNSLDVTGLRFSLKTGTKLPIFMGELFEKVFESNGEVRTFPCVQSIRDLRQLCYLFYKLELPYSPSEEQRVIDQFIQTDDSLDTYNKNLSFLSERFDSTPLDDYTAWYVGNETFPALSVGQIAYLEVVRKARRLLKEVFCGLDVLDVHPKHGPGAVSTREQFEDKYVFRTVSPRILQTYPLDAYYYASLGHVCDNFKDLMSTKSLENPARVCLVPKDSRGPRLISCEPLEFQWIQQGLKGAIVSCLESHPLTRHTIHFTNQQPNQLGALLGSRYGEYATLDLKEASDRISIGLVKLLFPEHLRDALLNTRSLSTVLPDGRVKVLNKFAPMGSATCFPVLATCVWALLQAGLPDADFRSACRNCSEGCTTGKCEGILVYGDDVVVPTAQAANAISILESFGLLVNRDKSCTSGFFRESCGMDAYKGKSVTPVKIRTGWSSHRCPDSYVSYVSYANEFYVRGYYNVYELLVERLVRLYGPIPEVSMNLSCPSLISVQKEHLPKRWRINPFLQKKEWYVTDVKAVKSIRMKKGWNALLRFFSVGTSDTPLSKLNTVKAVGTACGGSLEGSHFSVSSYTKQRTNYLVRGWR